MNVVNKQKINMFLYIFHIFNLAASLTRPRLHSIIRSIACKRLAMVCKRVAGYCEKTTWVAKKPKYVFATCLARADLWGERYSIFREIQETVSRVFPHKAEEGSRENEGADVSREKSQWRLSATVVGFVSRMTKDPSRDVKEWKGRTVVRGLGGGKEGGREGERKSRERVG